VNAFSEFLKRLVAKEIGEDQELTFQWGYMPDSWRLFLFIGIVLLLAYGIIWLYRREMNSCPRSVKMTLAVLRLLTLAFLIVLFLQPSIATITTSERKPNIVILEDGSQSLDRTDRYEKKPASADETLAAEGPAAPLKLTAEQVAAATGLNLVDLLDGKTRRIEIINRLFERNNYAFVQQLREKGSIRVFKFADKVEDLGTIPAFANKADENNSTTAGGATVSVSVTGDTNYPPVSESVAQLVKFSATGTSTDIWQALKEGLAVHQIGGIILISDGQHTTPDNPVEIARRAKEMGVPIFVLGVGDPGRPKNLFVSDVYVRSKVQPSEPFEIESVIYAQNIPDKTVTVELLRGKGKETTELQSIKSETVPVPEEGGRIPVDFSDTLIEPGEYVYSVRVGEVDGESNVEDNTRQAASPVEAIDEKVKILLIAGAPTWEYQMVQRLLQRDQSILLSCWLQTMDKDRPQEGNEPISVLPKTFEELGKYNAILLFDPNPDEFDSDWMDLLADFAEKKAGGILYKSGPKFTETFLTLERTKRLREILPVDFKSSDETDITRYLQSANTSSSPLQIVIPNIDHPVMTFHQDRVENLQRWQSMPGIYWSYPAVRAKPTSRVLLEHSDITMASDGENSRPLLVAGRYVRGNTLYIGFNGTWRWRRMGRQAQFFDRFWIQVVRFLVEARSLQGLRRGIVEPERDVYEVGDRIVFRARLQDPTFQPLKLPDVSAKIDLGNGQTETIQLKKLEGDSGEYEAVMNANRIGQFVLKVDLPGGDSDEAIEPVTFRVEAPRVEAAAFWLNEKLLRDIANASGGKYFSVDEFATLPEHIATSVEEIQWTDRPQPLWDVNRLLRTICFCIPVILLTLEWALRKGFKLL
jgi:hypothetical protein